MGACQAMKAAGDLARKLGRDGDARCWFERAAEAGHPQAMFDLGVLALKSGDVQAAAGWFQRAAEAGDPKGYAALTQLAEDRGDDVAERRWARLGAEVGHTFCVFRHGVHVMLDAGDDQPAVRRAAAILQAVAERGDLDTLVPAVDACRLPNQVEQDRKWAASVPAMGDPDLMQMFDRYQF
jgi:TPR repeat protein